MAYRRLSPFVAAAAALFACAGGTVKTPADVSGAIALEMLGGAPDLAATLHPRRMSGDPLWGSLVRCTAASNTGDPESSDLALRIETLDAWIREEPGGASAVFVARGTPRFDPTTFRGDTRTAWLAGRPIGAGVVEHAPTDAGKGLWLYVVPDGTYVLALGRAVERTRAKLARAGRAPSPLASDDTSVAAAWVDGAFAARHFGAGQDLEGASAATASVLSGPELAAIVRLGFDTEARAASNERSLREGLGKACGPLCQNLAPYVHFGRAGHELRLDVRAPGEPLEELRRVLCTSAAPKPEAHPLPEDWSKPAVLPPRIGQLWGREVVVGWTFELRGPRGAQQLGVFDEKGRPLFRVEARNTNAAATPNGAALNLALEHAIAGGRIALRDARKGDAISLFDLASGRRVADVPVPARGRLCASPRDGLVFVDDEDASRQTLITVDVAKAVASTRPPWCPARAHALACAQQPATQAACVDPTSAPDVPDFVPSHVLLAGDDGVVLGERASDRHVPMAAGFDARTRAVRWKRILPTTSPDVAAEGSPRLADIAGGKLVVEFDEWHGRWKLAALDVKTGAPAWDAALPEPLYFTLSPTRVWYAEAAATSPARLRVLELASGRPVSP